MMRENERTLHSRLASDETLLLEKNVCGILTLVDMDQSNTRFAKRSSSDDPAVDSFSHQPQMRCCLSDYCARLLRRSDMATTGAESVSNGLYHPMLKTNYNLS